MTPLIALYSPAPQSGKTTVAKFLESSFGFRRLRFAAPLKRMLREMLRCTLLAEDAIERCIEGDWKEQPIPPFGKSPRALMQTLGTEWGRNCVHPDLWVQLAMRQIAENDIPAVFDDMRFANEFAAIRERGGQAWCIRDPRVVGPPWSHISEAGLDGHLDDFDRVLLNNGTLLDLHALVTRALEAP